MNRSASAVASEARTPSLYPVRDPVGVEVSGGFLVAYTQVAEETNTVFIARLSDDGDLIGEPVLVGDDYITSPGDTFVEVESHAVLFVLNEQSGQSAYRLIAVANDGSVASDGPL
ncbi:MAG: hypothetical protein ACJAYU_000847 [Bradymonadia bacterium]|jgi:hypothetical protein